MGLDKITAPLAGKKLILYSLEAFQQVEAIDSIYLVTAGHRLEELEEISRGFSKLRKVVAGGSSRFDSVRNGLDAMDPKPELVAVHDGARPLVTPGIIRRVIEVAETDGAAACAERVTDTLHRTDDQNRTIETVPRDNLWRIQTPQIIRFDLLQEAAQSGSLLSDHPTDEVSAIRTLGARATLVENPDWNLKVTYPGDLALAENLLALRRDPSFSS